MPDCSVSVTVQKGWWDEKPIATRRDCIVNFAHVSWSRDSRLAGVFVDNTYCSGIRAGYDSKLRTLLPFDKVADQVRRSIMADYGLNAKSLAPYGGDPLLWAHYGGDGIVPPGVQAFRQKYHPERWP